MRSLNEVVLNALSDTSSQTSAAIDASQLFRVSVQASFTDSAVAGTLKLQCSNDPSSANNLPSLQTPTHWTDIPNTSQSITAGASVLIPSTEIAYRWIRVVFTETTPGSGTVTATLNALGY